MIPFIIYLFFAITGPISTPEGTGSGLQRQDRIDAGEIAFDQLTEASGIAASFDHDNVLWTHNDSGDRARVMALDASGRHLGVYTLAGARNRDWEDIALGPGPDPGVSYLYVGDIGDNAGRHDSIQIYRAAEPPIDAGQSPVDTTLQSVDTITLVYPDGPRDAETLMVDPATRDLYIISKREAKVGMYVARYPHNTETPVVLDHVATLPFSLATGGDISPNGDAILIKSYTNVYYWPRHSNQSVEEALQSPQKPLYYEAEPQGEAICWHNDGIGYYTTSEEVRGAPAHLYYYPLD